MARNILDAADVLSDNIFQLDLMRIGFIIGFAQGAVGVVTGLVKCQLLILSLIKGLVYDYIQLLFGNAQPVAEDYDAFCAALKALPAKLKLFFDRKVEEYKKASPEELAVMAGELVGEVTAFVASFFIPGALLAKGAKGGEAGVTVSKIAEAGETGVTMGKAAEIATVGVVVEKLLTRY